jgi:hypothetical protein
MESWCDKLAATPTMGFKLDVHFESIDSVLDALSPILDKSVEGERATFTVEKREPFSVNVNAQTGYHYIVEPSRISVAFQHVLKMKMVSGGPPVAQMTSRALPYTELLQSVATQLMDTTSLICDGSTRKISRIGVVASAIVDAADIPPGMARFITYIGRPWKGFADHYTFQITSQLADDPAWNDRCIHTLSKAEEDPDQLIRLNFDWQRSFKTSRPTTRDSMKELVKFAEDAALKYFEELAEGNLFDEKLIHEAS